MKRVSWIMMAALLLLSVPESRAAVTLRYSPADTTLAPGGTARISIMIDEPLDLRTIEVFVDFDPAVITTVSGGSGRLFTDSGFMLFQGFEETEPGSWHGYCVVMGSEDYISGPGELYYWEVGTVALGVSPVTTTSVALAAPDATVLPDVTLPGTTVSVVDPASGIQEVPGAPGGLELVPNPFNPRTRIRFDRATSTAGRLEVYDSRGRLVICLHDGFLPAGVSEFPWDGRDEYGRAQAAGVYFFRLATGRGVFLRKGMLVK